MECSANHIDYSGLGQFLGYGGSRKSSNGK